MTTTTDAEVPARPPGAPSGDGHRSYYGMPVVKEPEWTWEVPWYLFAGGLGGASSTMALVARLTGRPRLAGRLQVVAFGASVASPVLLIADLGRPRRFANMLRVFRPTSAMSVGSWLLSIYGTSAGAVHVLRAAGRLPRLARLLETSAAVTGLPMTTYTGVLVADSSIPVWFRARYHLPALFAASAAASAGAVGVVVGPTAEAGPARRVALAGCVAELAIESLMERRLGPVGEVYDRGDAGRYGKAAKLLTAAGAALVATGSSRAVAARAGAALVLAGSICQRWSVFRAGFQSARDPSYTVQPQRAERDSLAVRDGGDAE